MRRLTLTLSTAALAVSGVALAQNAPAREARPDLSRAEARAKAEAAFARMDTNRNGTLDAAELQTRRHGRADAPGKRDGRPALSDAQKDERRAAMFARADADGNGAISRAEFDVMHAARAGQRGGMQPGAAGKRRGPGMHPGLMATAAPVSKQAFVDRALGMFDKADADRNGTVTQAERAAARDALRQQWQARKAAGGEG